jgi:hypothetical protein
MKIKIRLMLALIFLVISLPLLVWGFWPPRRVTRVLPLLPAVGMANPPEAHWIELEFAPTMRAGDMQIVQLTLSAEEGAAADFYAEYSIVAEARLDLPLAEVRPAEIVQTALVEGGSATFYWEARPREAGTLQGTAWLYLQVTPRAGGEGTRQPVSAQLVEIRSKSVWGRTGGEARTLGVVGSLVGLGLSVPFIARKFRSSRNRTFPIESDPPV